MFENEAKFCQRHYVMCVCPSIDHMWEPKNPLTPRSD